MISSVASSLTPDSSPVRKTRTPKDLVEDSSPIHAENESSNTNLFDYFGKKDGSSVIKAWVNGFRTDALSSFCEVLSVILQIAGHRIEITVPYIESDAFDIVLSDFQEYIENNKVDPPITKFLKNKANILQNFWKDMANAIISCGALFNPIYGTFRQWLSTFSACRLTNVRHSACLCGLQLFESLAASMARNLKEIKRLRAIPDQNDQIVVKQRSSYENEYKVFQSATNHLYVHLITYRSRDVNQQIRILPILSLTEAVILLPEEFGEPAKLMYVGRALSDQIPKNRRDALRCMEKIIRELPDTNNCKALCEQNSKRILEMCDDRENSVVSSALECLLAMNERGVLPDIDCSHAADLLVDDSQTIRAAAAKFVASQFFKEKSDLPSYLEFINHISESDLYGVVASLYPYLGCLRDWELICDTMMVETDEKTNIILAQTLLYSAERTTGHLLNVQPESEEQIRILTNCLAQKLPRLLRAFQSEEDIVVPLIESARLISLDAISDSSSDHHFQQLLEQIRDLFIRCGQKRIFTTSIASLYELSVGNHQLNELARKELNALAEECSKIDDLDNESVVSKFLSAARLVDLCEDEAKKDQIISLIETSDNSDTIADCIECLDYFFRWDVKRIQTKPELKLKFLPTFNKYLDVFHAHLGNDNHKIFEASYKGLATLISLSPYFRVDDEHFAQIDESIIEEFYIKFHSLSNKAAMFEYAQRPLLIQTVDLSFAAHLLVYFSDSNLQPEVKALWKELQPYKPLNGRNVASAFENADLDEGEIKISARFMIVKFTCYDTLLQWFADGEDDSILTAMIMFICVLTPSDAESLEGRASERFDLIIEKIKHGEKITQKLITKLLSTRTQEKKPRNIAKKHKEEEEKNEELNNSDIEEVENQEKSEQTNESDSEDSMLESSQ